MTWLWPTVAKEARALAVPWLALTVAIAAFELPRQAIDGIALIAYLLGAAGLGAYAIGYELRGRTLEMLLTQPIERRLVIAAKLAVLGPMLAVLAGVAWVSMFREQGTPLEVVLLPVAGGLFVAPWLTIATRNPLAGTVFSMAIAGVTYAIADRVLGVPALLPWARVMWVFAAITGCLAWRAFVRLEATEGVGVHVQLPRLSRVEFSGDAHPLGQLVIKELRLQQVSLMVAGVYLFGALALAVRGVSLGDVTRIEDALGVLTWSSIIALSLIAGSLASAEERQLGVLESQQLLPARSSTQWFVKLGVTFALPGLLGLLLPAALEYLFDLGGNGYMTLSRFGLLLVFVVTATGLYVSSWSSSVARAVGVAFAACGGLTVVIGYVIRFGISGGRLPSQAALGASLAVFAALLVWFAAGHHRSSEHNVLRVALQMVVAVAVIPIGFTLASWGAGR